MYKRAVKGAFCTSICVVKDLPGHVVLSRLMWLYFTREPEQWIPPGVPRILLSESDFHNPERRDDGMILSLVLLIFV